MLIDIYIMQRPGYRPGSLFYELYVCMHDFCFFLLDVVPQPVFLRCKLPNSLVLALSRSLYAQMCARWSILACLEFVCLSSDY